MITRYISYFLPFLSQAWTSTGMPEMSPHELPQDISDAPVSSSEPANLLLDDFTTPDPSLALLDGLARFVAAPVRLEDLEPIPSDPPGLSIAYDVLTPAHERALIHFFQTNLQWPTSRPDPSDPNFTSNPSTGPNPPHLGSHAPKKPPRKSLHYGYRFCYRTFAIDRSVPFTPFPAWLRPLVPTWQGEEPAQVCLQHYPPGSGIPPHTDTHSAFDQLCGLSLGAPVQMDFRRGRPLASTESTTTDAVVVDLQPRSLIRMDGDARLHWTHGIRKRKTDVLDDGSVRPRGERWSITFRWLRKSNGYERAECQCGNGQLCDSEGRRTGVARFYRWKGEAE